MSTDVESLWNDYQKVNQFQNQVYQNPSTFLVKVQISWCSRVWTKMIKKWELRDLDEGKTMMWFMWMTER